jgi:hypothetical protein
LVPTVGGLIPVRRGAMKRDRKAALLSDERLGQMLRAIPSRMPPPGLTTSLRVVASRERCRRVGAAWMDRFHLFATNLMRPLALPFAGGVFSTVVLFSMLAPFYPVHGESNSDIPTMLSTEATIRGIGPIGTTRDDVIVDVIVMPNSDGYGRVVDYTIVSPHGAPMDEALRRNIENWLLFTEFTPATSFGQPTSSKIRLYLQQSSHIDVKG